MLPINTAFYVHAFGTIQGRMAERAQYTPKVRFCIEKRTFGVPAATRLVRCCRVPNFPDKGREIGNTYRGRETQWKKGSV